MRSRSPLTAVAATVAAIAAIVVVGGLLAVRGVLFGESPAPGPSRIVPLENQATAQDLRATHDAFGIEFLRPTMPLGTIWEANWERSRSFDGVDPEDRWFDADHGSGRYRVENGELHITGEIPRIYVYDPTLDRQWRDVEVTMYFKRLRDENVPYAGMTAVARTNHLDTESGTRPCDTRGIGARVRYDGHIDFEKETVFPLNHATHNKELWQAGLPFDQWIGLKYLVYDQRDGVHLEMWLDLTEGRDGGEWQLVNQLVDDGHVLGEVACAPGINPQMALTNDREREGSETGLPNLTVLFRSDRVARDGLVYKWGSIREIDVTAD